MDEVLKRRLIGAAVLLIIALVIATLLPPPGALPEPEPGMKTVLIDLRAPPLAPAVQPSPPAEDIIIPVKESADELPSAPAETLEPEDAAPAEAPPAPKPALKIDDQIDISKVPAKPAEPAPIAKPAATMHEPWYVQVGAFGEVDNARQLLAKLESEGLRGIISPAETSGGIRYRARIGPYAERVAAEKVRDRLAERGLKGTIVQE